MFVKKKGETWQEGGDWFTALEDVNYEYNRVAMMSKEKDREQYLYEEWVSRVYCWGDIKPTDKDVATAIATHESNKNYLSSAGE
jgi:hypothetical protein